jgi:predicted RNase H-like nuclease (RuvC/YqgF family)
MPQNKKKVHAPRKAPIDAIREMFEDQQLQINDLSETVKKQHDEIRTLKAKWSARESLEKEEKERLEREADKSWFWAARTSE